MKLKIKLLDAKCLPERKYKDDAGIDIKYRGNTLFSLGQFRTEKLPTGICMSVPKGYMAEVRPRSGMASKGVTAVVGTIDSGFTGEINVVLINNTDTPYHIQPYDRIAQIVLRKIDVIDSIEVVDSLEETERGDKGFGSTGRGALYEVD